MNQDNIGTFRDLLTGKYTELFANDPDYAYSASRIDPETLANKMTIGLGAGTANKDGKAIRYACRTLGIKHTYKAINAYFNS
jgi:hypothetical protein